MSIKDLDMLNAKEAVRIMDDENTEKHIRKALFKLADTTGIDAWIFLDPEDNVWRFASHHMYHACKNTGTPLDRYSEFEYDVLVENEDFMAGLLEYEIESEKELSRVNEEYMKKYGTK